MSLDLDVASHVDDWCDLTALKALDLLSNPIMIADSEMVIRYVNEAAYRMFDVIEPAIRADLPHFRARDVLGKSIDYFHKNPSYQRGIMDKMSKPHDGRFTVGGKTLSFRATPNMGPAGELRSIFVEWVDRTGELKAEAQVTRLIAEVRKMSALHVAGMIRHVIPVDELEGRYAEVASDVNEMVVGHIERKKAIIECIAAFARGDLDFNLREFQGESGFINEAMEAVRMRLRAVTDEIEVLSQAIVEGELSRSIALDRHEGAFRRIIAAFERAYVSLSDTFGTVRGQVSQMVDAVAQVAESADRLSENSQRQAVAVEEISSSSNETDSMVRSNAAATNRARDLAQATGTVSQDGLTRVGAMVEAMEDIRQAAGSIAKIIKEIDGISFQTNLLALNAAVEAARAGQHGRGFAVVAQEVRNLASRSAKAARETGDLIDQANAVVKRGVAVADETQGAFQRIAADIAEIEGLLREIAGSSDEQARGMSMINSAMSDVATTTALNSSQAEELAAATAQMRASTESMRQTMQRFQLRQNAADGAGGGGMRGAPAAKAPGLPDLAALSPQMQAQLREMIATQLARKSPRI